MGLARTFSPLGTSSFLLLYCLPLFLLTRGSPLSDAIKDGKSVAQIQKVLEETRNSEHVNAFDEDGLSPLMHAILNHNWELVELLIKNGARTMQRQKVNNEWSTPFDKAVKDAKADARIMQILLDSGAGYAFLSAQDIMDIITKDPKLVSRLLEHDVDFTGAGHWMGSPLTTVIGLVHQNRLSVDVLEDVLSSHPAEDVKQSLNEGYGLFHTVQMRAWGLIGLLIDYGANVLPEDRHDNEVGPIEMALRLGVPAEVLESMLQSQPEDKIAAYINGTPYLMSGQIAARRWDIVKMLLKYGADVTRKELAIDDVFSHAIANGVGKDVFEVMLASHDREIIRNVLNNSSRAFKEAAVRHRFDLLPLLRKYSTTHYSNANHLPEATLGIFDSSNTLQNEEYARTMIDADNDWGRAQGTLARQ